jgi:hypothetical protein
LLPTEPAAIGLTETVEQLHQWYVQRMSQGDHGSQERFALSALEESNGVSMEMRLLGERLL